MKTDLPNSPNSPNESERGRKTPPKPTMFIARAKPRRRFTSSDIDSICRNCARGLTESESVRLLGKSPIAWFSFKSRASRTQAFADKLEQFQGQRIDQLLQQIEDAGTGKNRREPDWRASLAALKIMSQKRFGDHAGDLTVNTTTNNNMWVAAALEGADRAYKEIERLTPDEREEIKRLTPKYPVRMCADGFGWEHYDPETGRCIDPHRIAMQRFIEAKNAKLLPAQSENATPSPKQGAD